MRSILTVRFARFVSQHSENYASSQERTNSTWHIALYKRLKVRRR